MVQKLRDFLILHRLLSANVGVGLTATFAGILGIITINFGDWRLNFSDGAQLNKILQVIRDNYQVSHLSNSAPQQ